MFYHFLSMLSYLKTYVEIKIFQKNINMAKRLGKQVNFAIKDQKIIIAVAHVVPPAQHNDAGKLTRLTACLDCLHNSFAAYPYKIVLLSKKNHSIHRKLPTYLRKGLDIYWSDQPDPMFVEFDAYEVFKPLVGDYDYFIFLEDDILLNDSWLINKIADFNTYSPQNSYVLLPHRFEYHNGIKYYLDQIAVNGKALAYYSYIDMFKVKHGHIKYCIYENPHAAFYCLNKTQIYKWVQSGYKWKNKVVAIGPLESAATFAMFENFKFMKPHPDCAGYFELQHFGHKYMMKENII
jgi:hypothetical protein